MNNSGQFNAKYHFYGWHFWRDMFLPRYKNPGKNLLWYFALNCPELFNKTELFISSRLSIDHFWWIILDNLTQNIIFIDDIFDATCFRAKQKSNFSLNSQWIFPRFFFRVAKHFWRDMFSQRNKNPGKNPLCTMRHKM